MQRADKRKFHYIYKIIRDDGRYYIGMHSTDNLDDGYFGSGKRITRSIKKHGRERHRKEILEFLPTRYELKIRETELVTEELRSDPMCMNIAPGGGGGFNNAAHRKKWVNAARFPVGSDAAIARGKAAARTKALRRQNPEYAKSYSEKLSQSALANRDKFTFAGKKHSDETKAKMRGPRLHLRLGHSSK